MGGRGWQATPTVHRKQELCPSRTGLRGGLWYESACVLLLLLVLLGWRVCATPKSAIQLAHACLPSGQLAIDLGAARPAKIRSAVPVAPCLGAAARVELNSFAARAHPTPLYGHGSVGGTSYLPAGGSS